MRKKKKKKKRERKREKKRERGRGLLGRGSAEGELRGGRFAEDGAE